MTKRNADGSVGITECRYYNYDDFQRMANKLADYEDAEEQGLLLRLPCRVSDTVWILQRKCIHSGENNEPWKSCGQYWDNVHINGMWGCAGRDDEGNPLICEKKEMEWFARQMEYTLVLFSPNIVLGKNMFLTKAEAEEALRKMNGGDKGAY